MPHEIQEKKIALYFIKYDGTKECAEKIIQEFNNQKHRGGYFDYCDLTYKLMLHYDLPGIAEQVIRGKYVCISGKNNNIEIWNEYDMNTLTC